MFFDAMNFVVFATASRALCALRDAMAVDA
jgi:hypothetical protein